MKIKDIPINSIDIAEENIRKNDAFGEDEEDLEFASNIKKMDLFQPVVVRYDKGSKRYKLLIGRRRFFSYKDKGEKTIPAVISTLEGAEARAASLFENMMRRDLSPLEKAQQVKDLIEITPGGMNGVERTYGIAKSSQSEWMKLLKLPDALKFKLQKGEIGYKEAVRIARKSGDVQTSIGKLSGHDLDAELVRMGIKRGAPKGLETIRLVWDPRDAREKKEWHLLSEAAAKKGQKVQDFVRGIVMKVIKA